jgi:hypothetical protein
VVPPVHDQGIQTLRRGNLYNRPAQQRKAIDLA